MVPDFSLRDLTRYKRETKGVLIFLTKKQRIL